MQPQEQQTNSFELLWNYLCEQFRAPVGHFSYWVYFLVAILGAGGLGIWVELYKMTKVSNAGGVITAIYTYFLAVAAGAAFQIGFEEDSRKYVRSFAFLSFVVIMLPAFFHAAGVMEGEAMSLVVGSMWTLGALALWWVANGKNLSLHDSFDPNDALGAAPTTKVEGDSGDIKL
jgi:hypothetical protein